MRGALQPPAWQPAATTAAAYFILFDSQPVGTLSHTWYLHCSRVGQPCHNTCGAVARPSGARPEWFQWVSGGHSDRALITCSLSLSLSPSLSLSLLPIPSLHAQHWQPRLICFLLESSARGILNSMVLFYLFIRRLGFTWSDFQWLLLFMHCYVLLVEKTSSLLAAPFNSSAGRFKFFFFLFLRAQIVFLGWIIKIIKILTHLFHFFWYQVLFKSHSSCDWDSIGLNC